MKADLRHDVRHLTGGGLAAGFLLHGAEDGQVEGVGEIGKSLAGAMFKTGDGYLDLDLKDGDILKVQCQAGIGGKVSIKVLK